MLPPLLFSSGRTSLIGTICRARPSVCRCMFRQTMHHRQIKSGKERSADAPAEHLPNGQAAARNRHAPNQGARRQSHDCRDHSGKHAPYDERLKSVKKQMQQKSRKQSQLGAQITRKGRIKGRSNHQKALFERNGRKPASGNPPQSGKKRPQTGMTGRQHPAVPERPFGKSAATAQKTETLLGLVQQKAAGKEPEQPPRRQEHRRGRRHHTLGV